MRKLALYLTLFLIGLTAHAADSSALPKNRLRIPVGHRLASDITKEEFFAILKKVRETHAPFFTHQGARLRIKADWDDAAVNAFADRDGDTYILEILGGLARHPTLTRDGFALLVCHEMGHHLGGAPTGMDLGWPSIEGQSDYFATLKCLRRLFKGDDNETRVKAHADQLTLRLVERCERAFRAKDEMWVCLRSSLAGLSAATLLHQLDKRGPAPSFDARDPRIVKKTEPSHPEAQCRLDTYVAGAICPADSSVNPDLKNPTVGVCFETRESDGFRPRCWYKPELPPGTRLRR